MNAVVLCLSLIVIGIALAIAGFIITILDGNQINRMKHFGDISYLISWI
jgi:VIT1/CCC1 family predicted Fe2+/Mn2+ transporter